MEKVIVQKIKFEAKDEFLMAEKYYSILSSINSLSLTEREIQLIAFAALKGNISYANIREEFCIKHSTSSPTMNNMISKLKKKGIFIKDGTKVKVNPIIIPPFKSTLILQIKLSYGEA